MKKFLVSLAAATALVSASPASANDQQAVNWSGWYAGIFANYSSGNLNAHPIHFTAPINDDGGVFGLLGGYRMQTSNDVVYGVQLNVPVVAGKGSSFTFAGNETATMRFAAIVTGQVGRAYGPWLPLVSFGGGFVNVRSTNAIGAPTSQTVTHPALTAGLGVNYAVTENVAVGARYNYTKIFRRAHVTTFNAATDNRFGAELHSFGAVLEFKLPIGN